jgi:hypothetical protein
MHILPVHRVSAIAILIVLEHDLEMCEYGDESGLAAADIRSGEQPLHKESEMFKPRHLIAMFVLTLVGCSGSTSTRPIVLTERPVEAPQIISPTETVRPSNTQGVEETVEVVNTEAPTNPDVRIRIVTTSDWTIFRIVRGVALETVQILSSSSEASTASFDQDYFQLIQPISRAEEGKSVELVVDLSFSGGSLGQDLEFEIDRGHIGGTTVEMFSYACGNSVPVASFTWDEIKESGENIQAFLIPSAQLTGFVKNEYTVIAQLNFWYYGPGEFGGFENRDGERMTPLTPLLGETYWASDPDVVYQQIEWAAEYGVDAFSIEWTTPRGVGCCGSMEDTLDDVFLKSPNIQKVRWTIFYDFVLRLDQTRGLRRYVGTFDFDEPDVRDTLVSDFKHFAEKYFGHPQYLTIDGRPVIYIWATAAYTGDLEGALREAREEVSKLGYDVFIVGDEIQADHFDPYHASLFDGNSTFTFLIGGLDIFSWNDLGDAIEPVDQAFKKWRAQIKDLKVIDRDDLVNFQPAWAPQYDDTLFVGGQGIYVPANSKEQVIAMAEVARRHAEPVGSQEQRLIWLNTWNNWAETTTVEPTANLGSKYPAGNYQFDMLEVVREVFGSETYSCDLP